MTDAGYTPSFERVRDLYSWAIAWRTNDAEGETDLSGLRERNRAEFDRTMAAHDAEVAAKALRDAAEEFVSDIGITEFDALTSLDGIHWSDIDEAWEHQGPFMDWLRNRAASIAAPNTAGVTA